MIEESMLVKCPWCGNTHTVKEWDDNSYKCCNNRDERRHYLHLNNEKAFDRKAAKHYYKCITCGNWSAGSQLKLMTNNPEYSLLGGEPLNITMIDARGVEEQ